jgi:hypothetical protein
MTVELIGILTLLCGVAGLFQSPSFIVYVFVCSTLLGASAAMILSALGGVSVPPAHLLLGFLILRLLNEKAVLRRMVREVAPGRPGFWLLLVVVYSTLTAYFLPRLFAGQTATVPVRAESAYLVPLEPSMSNLTQSMYFIGDLVCFMALSGYATSQHARRVLGDAALACVVLNLGFAALDLVTYFTNTTDLLSFIRNATYTMLNDTEAAGFKRIVGSFVEASAFGAITLAYFAYVGTLWTHGIRPRLTSTLTFLSFAALIFSTSTTAYVGLLAFLAFAYLAIILRIFYRPITRQMVFFIFGLPLLGATIVTAIALNDTYSIYFRDLMDTFVFNKMTTDSGMARAAWNQQGIQNFFDTFGFGAGNGSVRASSYPVAVISSLGLIGAVLLGLFLISVFVASQGRHRDPLDDAYRQAAKAACLAGLITATVSGALVDLGLAFFVFAALACSQSAEAPFPAKLRLPDGIPLRS